MTMMLYSITKGPILLLGVTWLLATVTTRMQNHVVVSAFSTSPSVSRLVGGNGGLVSSSFVGTGRSRLHHQKRTTPTTTGTSRHGGIVLAMVIDTMSNDCVAAIKASHDLGNDMGMTVMTKELLFAGIVRHPERARKTLTKYNIDSDEVRQAVMEVLKYAPGITIQQPSATNEPLQEPKQRQPLPFDAESKLLLNRALAIAESMESSVTRSEHVLLALMGYNNGKKIDSSPILSVLQRTKSISRTDAGFKVYNFCDDLVNDLPLTPTTTTVEREAVVIGAGSGTTNTLAEVGVDMTQMAMEGKYDAVYGRNDEIKSVLRTLGRRRKNNPCLIGGTYLP